jgi:glycosyltransferase involved in cell wall biosynthesis
MVFGDLYFTSSLMKILLMNDYGTPTGGAELLIIRLRDGLRLRGHDARLFTSSARPIPVNSQADYECFGTTSRFRTVLQTANPWAFFGLRRVLAEFKPDVIHVAIFLTQLSPLILPLLKEVPSIYHAVWYRTICPLGTKTLPEGNVCQDLAGPACFHHHCLTARAWLPLMAQMKLWRQWQSAFNLIVAHSDALKRRLMEEGVNVSDVVRGGVPIQRQRPSLSSPPTVAFAGRLVREKGADMLLHAFAKVVMQLPEARLLLVGDGPEHEHLKKLIPQWRLSTSVSLLGQLPPLEMERRFASAWVQVVPSRWAEPFGLAAVDAMMRGTAVIASDSGGLSEIVRQGETGSLVTPGNVDALADALLGLLQNRERAEQMGRAGHQAALHHFSEAIFVDRFIQLYHTLL